MNDANPNVPENPAPADPAPTTNLVFVPVESSRIEAIAYDPDTETLAVRFKSNKVPGQVYHYHDVSQETYDAMLAAESKGTFFYANIYEKVKFSRVEPDGTVSKRWSPADEPAPETEQPAAA